MTRLQKKCLIAAAGTHLLLVVAVLCSGFIKPRPRPDPSDVLTVIPANLVDAAVKSGVRGAQPPPPTPIVQPPAPAPQPPPPQPQPQPEPPKPEVQPPEPPKPELQPEDLRPAELPEPKPVKKHEIRPDLTKVTRTVPKVTDNSAAEAKAKAEAEAKADAEADAKAARAAKRAAAARARAFEQAASSIRDNASSATSVDMPGTSTVAYANYSSVVLSIYTENWRVPDSTTSDDAIVKASVTIARDGHVIEAHIVDRCGDSSVDNSVQKTLDRVREIRPFPDDATDQERTYIINFNLKAKRQMLG